MEGGFETLKQIATSSIFMQNEIKSSKNKISPYIHNSKQQNDEKCSTNKQNDDNHWSLRPQPFFYKIPQIQNEAASDTTSNTADHSQNENAEFELISLKSLSVAEKEIVLNPSSLQNIE